MPRYSLSRQSMRGATREALEIQRSRRHILILECWVRWEAREPDISMEQIIERVKTDCRVSQEDVMAALESEANRKASK